MPELARGLRGSTLPALVPPFNPNLEFLSVVPIDASKVTPPGDSPDTRNANERLIAQLESEHPTFQAMKVEWFNFLNWYCGDNIEQYLYQHIRERIEVFRRRQERAFYFNYVQSIVDLISSFLYSKTIVRSLSSDQGIQTSDDDLDEFWKNIDLKDTSINEFMQKVFTFSQIFGHVDVIIDVPELAGEDVQVFTEEDRRNLQLRPYAFIVSPLSMINWNIDTLGNFRWVRWRETLDPNTQPFSDHSDVSIVRYTTWDKHEWIIHDIIGEGRTRTVSLVASGENHIGEVPVVRFFGKQSIRDETIGKSFIALIGKINIAILNWSSLLDEEIFQKTLNILVMEDAQTEDDSLTIGNNNVLLWSGQTPPFYLAPASDPGQFILSIIEKSIDEIFRLSTIGGETGIREAKSGIAYSFEFNNTNRMLVDKANLMEKGEIKLHQLRAKWMNTEFTGIIDYPDRFNVEIFEEELAMITNLKGAVRSPTFKRELEKQVALRALVKSPSDVQDKVIAEIDTMESGILPVLPTNQDEKDQDDE